MVISADAATQVVHEVSSGREVIANISGAVSIACWVTILSPQLLEQWRLKSADGVAIGFSLAWFFGDLANLGGAILGKSRPSVILLALWFCFSDTLLVLSYWYYKHLAANRHSHHPAPTSPRSISPARDAEHGLGTPHSQNQQDRRDRRSAYNASASREPGSTSTTPLLQEHRNDESDRRSPEIVKGAANRGNWLSSTGIPAIFVIVVATLSYFISDSAAPDMPEQPVSKNFGSEVLGYISAVLYITARIPQMVQNHRRRSVEGSSMGFFALSVLGNSSYAGQVISYRTDRDWLVMYIPWLLGSLGTIAEDLIILAQFHIYKRDEY